MKTTLAAIGAILLLPLCLALGQERLDVVHLKNGDILKGVIVENVPNDYVKIELPGGSLFTVKYADISKFSKEKTSAQSLDAPKQGQLDARQVMTFEQEKKSPSTGVLLSLLLPTAGHAYADNWSRGLLFGVGRVGGVVLALTLGFQSDTYSTPNPYGYSWNYYYETEEQMTTWFYVGIGIAAASMIWEAIDASGEVDKYNEELYKSITGKKPISMNIVPTEKGLQLQLQYSF